MNVGAPPDPQVPRSARDDTSTQPPIADYAIIGCTRSAALISRAGSIDWLAWPRFDAPSVFARILDWQRGGCFSIAPAVPFRATRRYVGDTNVLETTFETDGGAAKLIDLMPVMNEEAKQTRLTPFRQLMRRIECVRGEVPIEIVYAPRPEYARVTPRLEQRRDSIVCVWGAHVLHLRSDVPLAIDNGTATASVALKAGESRTFALTVNP